MEKRDHMKSYDTFLADVIKANSDQFQEASDVVTRFETLKKNEELLVTQNEDLTRGLNMIND